MFACSSMIPNSTKPNINVNMKAMYLPSIAHCVQSISKGVMIMKLKLIFSGNFIVNAIYNLF